MLSRESPLALPVPLAQSDRQTLIFLAAVPGVGQRTLWRCWQTTQVHPGSLWSSCHANSLEKHAVLSASQQAALRFHERTFSRTSYLAHLQAQKITTWVLGDSTYPRALEVLGPDAPVVLFGLSKGIATEGDTPIHEGKINEVITAPAWVAVVGTRHPTRYGLDVTTRFTTKLVAARWGIVSGFMTGVDVCAHRAAQQAGGMSLGVLGFGFSFQHPRGLLRYRQEFLDNGGVLVTEFAPEKAPAKGTFLARNRVVAALASLVLVTEAGVNSGALRTAAWATRLGKAVAAVPGSVFAVGSAGCHALLRQGAMAWDDQAQQNWIASSAAGSQSELRLMERDSRQVLRELEKGKATASVLAQTLGWQVAQTLAVLAKLELRGAILCEGGRWRQAM